jgi:hypothetical protein
MNVGFYRLPTGGIFNDNKCVYIEVPKITECYHQSKHFPYQNNDNKSAQIELPLLKIILQAFVDV